MSNIYIQEPPTNGKVLLKTTAGDIDIELWSKEAPKACRNFIQLCLEAYYDNTIFHRVVPGFIVQGGDPTGTGTGGESIYGAPFKDEFHSRLRFNRRGLVAMANAGPHDNGSQFFFTLGRADELNNKHTIFGKVTGDTIYNMLRLTEVDIGDEERPRNPHKIKSCEVLFNPFDDIIPREIKKPKKEKPEEEVKKLKPKGTKNFSLLSFGEEAEEEEEEVNRVSQSMKGKSKSSHDLLKDDPHLSSVPAVESEKGDATEDLDDDAEDENTEPDEYIDGDEQNPVRERIAKKLKKDTGANVNSAGEGEAERKSVSRSEELRKESRQLKRELLAAKQKKLENATKAEKKNEASSKYFYLQDSVTVTGDTLKNMQHLDLKHFLIQSSKGIFHLLIKRMFNIKWHASYSKSSLIHLLCSASLDFIKGHVKQLTYAIYFCDDGTMMKWPSAKHGSAHLQSQLQRG
ncbi:peptidyl-prolyl cis-trans isomerase CWC27 homolog isoform X2 [Heterocephalus glaber]|uniref:Spliceosome-associated protein CWC27 homolog n=1 Tax=Heterocephalus glaber TaxID=10181 RepID=A0AAX6RQ02_HETGA|nr:peptidyl-prolyl cis-trans isomerase CWC27 homolog isoform X2 [Heterocephalus glaber]